jgi:Domain of unknown function (DUF4340)
MKKNLVAVCVLALLGFAAFAILNQGPDEQQERVQEIRATVLEPVASDKVSRLEVLRHEGSGSTLREELMVFEKAADSWRLVTPVEYSANQVAVQAMLEVLSTLQVIDVISEKVEKHRILEVDEELGIKVKAFAGDELLVDFIIGVTRGKITFVKLPGGDAVYRTSGGYRLTFNKTARDFRDRTVTALDRGSVTRVKYFSRDGGFEMVKKGEGDKAVFEPIGAELNNFDTQRALKNAEALTVLTTRDYLDEPLGEEITGLGADAIKVEFDASKDGEPDTFTIRVGNTIKNEGLTYLETSISEQVFKISSHLVPIFTVKGEDLSRTDEQVVGEAESMKHAQEHIAEHEKRRELMRAAKEATEADHKH